MWLITHVAWHELTAVISLTVPPGARGSVKVVWFSESAFVSRLPRDAAAVFGVCGASQTKHEPLKDKLKELLCWNSPSPLCILNFSEWLLFTFMWISICKHWKLQCVWASARAAPVWRCSLVLMVGLGQLITASKWRALGSRVTPLKCLRVDLLHRLNSWSCQLSPWWF